MAKKKTQKKKQTVTEQLRNTLEKSGLTHYRIGKMSSVPPNVLDRFINGQRKHLRSDTIDRLCEALGLELRPKR